MRPQAMLTVKEGDEQVETRDVRAKPALLAAAALAVLLLAFGLYNRWLLLRLERRGQAVNTLFSTGASPLPLQEPPPPPRLQLSSALELKQLQAAALQRLHSYGRNADGSFYIPIEAAMQLYEASNPPVAAAAPPKESP